MNRHIRLGSAIALALSLAWGCEPKEPQAPVDPAPAGAPAEEPAVPPPAPAEVFRKPAPTEAGHDPRVAAAAESSRLISASLSIIHRRLSDLKEAYETRAQTEDDLRKVAARMKPLLAAAREDCDHVLRAARDVRSQLPFVAEGYAAAAASYRQRAEGYGDQSLKAVTLQVADEFERLALDIPRRMRLTDAFIEDLGTVQEFLAETDRCLRDTATALSIFAAGEEEPKASFGGRVFRARLEEFMAVVSEYQKTLLPRPAARERKIDPPARVDPEPSPPGDPAQADPFQKGAVFRGEVCDEADTYAIPATLRFISRGGKEFQAEMTFTGRLRQGRRGVRGDVLPDGRTLVFHTVWEEGRPAAPGMTVGTLKLGFGSLFGDLLAPGTKFPTWLAPGE